MHSSYSKYVFRFQTLVLTVIGLRWIPSSLRDGRFLCLLLSFWITTAFIFLSMFFGMYSGELAWRYAAHRIDNNMYATLGGSFRHYLACSGLL